MTVVCFSGATASSCMCRREEIQHKWSALDPMPPPDLRMVIGKMGGLADLPDVIHTTPEDIMVPASP